MNCSDDIEYGPIVGVEVRSPATQTTHPWRATIRTLIAAVPLVPVIIAELGVGSVPWVASGLAVIAAVTRLLALPAVDQWLTDHLGGALAAQPRDY